MRCGVKLRLSSRWATLRAGNVNEIIMAPMAGSGGIPESGVRLCVGMFGRHLDSFAVKVFSHLI